LPDLAGDAGGTKVVVGGAVVTVDRRIFSMPLAILQHGFIPTGDTGWDLATRKLTVLPAARSRRTSSANDYSPAPGGAASAVHRGAGEL
jgi:hypothetical protein